MSLLYYSRMRFITNLLPNLLSSTLPSGAKLVSIYAGGMEWRGTLYPADLSLENHYSFANCGKHAIVMKTMFFEDLATKHEGKISCSHIYPGLVVHKGFDDPSFPWWFRIAWRIAKPFVRFFPMYLEAEEIGQRVLYLATDKYPARASTAKEGDIRLDGVARATNGVGGGGAYSVTYTNEINDVGKFYQELRPKDFKESVLQHTKDVFGAVEKDGVFRSRKTD